MSGSREAEALADDTVAGDGVVGAVVGAAVVEAAVVVAGAAVTETVAGVEQHVASLTVVSASLVLSYVPDTHECLNVSIWPSGLGVVVTAEPTSQ